MDYAFRALSEPVREWVFINFPPNRDGLFEALGDYGRVIRLNEGPYRCVVELRGTLSEVCERDLRLRNAVITPGGEEVIDVAVEFSASK